MIGGHLGVVDDSLLDAGQLEYLKSAAVHASLAADASVQLGPHDYGSAQAHSIDADGRQNVKGTRVGASGNPGRTDLEGRRVDRNRGEGHMTLDSSPRHPQRVGGAPSAQKPKPSGHLNNLNVLKNQNMKQHAFHGHLVGVGHPSLVGGLDPIAKRASVMSGVNIT